MKRIILITLSAISLGASAQSISLDFGYHPNKQCVVYLKNGIRQDTIFDAKLDIQGKAKIALPKEFTAYKGMANVTVNNPATLDFIVAGENLTIRCPEEYPHAGNVEFINSKENNSLRDWFTAQSIREQKLGMLSELKQQYKTEDTFLPNLTNEITKLETEQSDFEVLLEKSSLYTAKFIRFNNSLNKDIAPLFMADSVKQQAVRQYVTDSLDFDNLYSSGLWFASINGLLEIYGTEGKYHPQFIPDITKGMKRIQSHKVYIALAEDIHAICAQLKWDNQQQDLLAALANEGRLKKGDSEKLDYLFQLFTWTKNDKSGIAPTIAGLSKTDKKYTSTLIAFYDSNCGSCVNEMIRLVNRYSEFKEKNIRVVSVSADKQKLIHEHAIKDYPWDDTLCDYKGFDGINFKNFGVIGTPSYFLIGADNKLIGQYFKAENIDIGATR